ncbi:hypothetical protein [Cytophaga aurantiaca]|uniref:hypothetical protein n=1 Tax=Cytophaga aurantiaca TaxID=29530 RepID=UPI000364AECA|nr:hypothetical protein [Cytophaga aurantiaca]
MMNMYSIKKRLYIALGIFSFFTLCGFLSVPINARTEFFKSNSIKRAYNELDFTIKGQNPISNLNNGSIQLKISEGVAPFKILIYSTTTAVKEYQVKEELTINNLAAGEYMIVVSGGNNQYRSKTITLRQE